MYMFTMFLGVYWIGLFIYLIVLYIKGLKSKKLSYFKLINKISWINIGLVGLYEILYSILDKSNDLGIILVWLLGAISAITLFISFLISFITSKIIKDKLDKTINKFNKTIIIILIINIIFMGIGISPLINDIFRRKEYSKYIESYLTKKYGDGDFKVVNIDDQRGDLWNSSNTYECDVETSYMSYRFEVEIDISTKEIVDSSFLRNYAMNKKICNNGAGIDTCIEEYIIKDYKEKLIHKDEYLPSLSVHIQEKNIKEDFGRIPETKELLKYTDIDFNYFTFYKNFEKDNEQEFINYVTDMYKDYQKYFEKYNKNTDKTKIKFRYKYGNPYTTDRTYKYDGYIIVKDNNLLIYNKVTPIIVPIDK